ncbi:MAG: formate dehydrogenase subunit alpha [Alphaproteobacteria bacterium]|nr:formate dehydrogenase subunit alpha [Alphaproteobacteria bacterium]
MYALSGRNRQGQCPDGDAALGHAAARRARNLYAGCVDLRTGPSGRQSDHQYAALFPGACSVSAVVSFNLDGRTVEAGPDETIWQVAERSGVALPHLCYSAAPGYRADGNCRVCMVEIEGERTLAASCRRRPAPGMVVRTESDRARRARQMVMELLLADQPPREHSPSPRSRFWQMAEATKVRNSRFPASPRPAADRSHPAMAVQLDACIHCNLCVRACREVQVNDVIGLAYRGAATKVVFDFDDPMGTSTCVGCGECVQACPTGALVPAGEVWRQHEDRAVDSVCPYCGVGCQLTYHIKNDRLLHVSGKDGPANHGRLCVKGRFGFDYVSHPQRLTAPLVRREGVGKALRPDVDPANPYTHFRPASWAEALDRAAEGLRRIRDGRGGRALAGFGSAKGSNEEAYLFQKLVRTGFGSNNVDHCTRLCHASSVAALIETIGSSAVTAPFAEVENAEVIMVIGSNTSINHPVAATFFKNAVKNGRKLIVFDPRGEALARHATHMVRFKPGTDVALLNAIMHVIVTEELFDRNYIAAYTEGFEQMRQHLANFSPEVMASLCGVPPDLLRQVARLYATARSAMIFWGMGISQHIHGTDNARCLIDLALMCGQIGRPGTGLHPLRGQNNVQGASDVGLIPMFFPDYVSVENAEARQRFEALWGVTLDPRRGLTVVEVTDAIHAGSIAGMYIMGENPAMSDPNLNHARAALAKLDHLVVQDIFLTETACYADVILPASAFPEKDGTFTNTDRRVQLGRRALPLPGDARQDLWIIQEIARRLGLDWHYDAPRQVFTEMRRCMPSLHGISWDRLEREGAVTYPCDGESEPGHAILFDQGFPTPSRRGRFVPAAIVPPDEQPDATYPMVLSTGRLLEHWHTGAMTRRASILDELEPQAVAHLSPSDMEEQGIAPGDTIRIRTRRGAIELAVRLDSGIPQGMVFMPFCYAEAAANLLTNPALDPYGKIPEFKYCAAHIERVAPS